MNNNPRMKSCIRVYNNTEQPVTCTPTTLDLEGIPVVNSGCSLGLNTAGVVVNNSGLYHFSADVTFTAKGKEPLELQLYKDGVALPSTYTVYTIPAGETAPVHLETELCIHTCCVSHPVITLVVSGVSGVVNHLSFGALKLA